VICLLLAGFLGLEPAAAQAGVRERLRELGVAETYEPVWDRAQDALRGLRGQPRRELTSVLRTVEGLERGGLLAEHRLPLVFRTVDANRAWWSARASGPAGGRVSFPPSRLVWQHYPGRGLQVQWLATFGRANGLSQSGGHEPEFRRLVEEALALAAERAGGLAWESLFSFGGGAPPWVSALTQGTAISALVRARRLDEARAALGVFRTPPPAGVRVVRGPGRAHFLQYSFAPALRIYNGFAQSLNGLLDLATIGPDEGARALFLEGEAEARADLPNWMTGTPRRGWSRYSNRRESDVHYHRLLRDFVRSLCSRLLVERGGALPDAAPYCAAAERFSRDLRVPPRVAAERAGTGRVRFTLDEPAVVTLLAGGRPLVTRRFGSGRHVLVQRGARGPLALRAVDLAGNAVTVRAT